MKMLDLSPEHRTRMLLGFPGLENVSPRYSVISTVEQEVETLTNPEFGGLWRIEFEINLRTMRMNDERD